jgi:hypothetical protein
MRDQTFAIGCPIDLTRKIWIRVAFRSCGFESVVLEPVASDGTNSTFSAKVKAECSI